ncbi:helix-turn-helix domain-containing protein [Halovulum sp. GXIMD14794]
MEHGERHAAEGFLEFAAPRLVPDPSAVIMERHRPYPSPHPYHHHASIEINFLHDCAMEYSFSGQTVRLEPGHPTMFWGAAPHKVIRVEGDGRIVNFYVSLAQFFRWSLPLDFIDALLSGAVVTNARAARIDQLLFDRWADDCASDDPKLRALMVEELANRVRRMALEDWSLLRDGASGPNALAGKGRSMLHVETMLRFISDNFTAPITVTDVAEHADLSPRYAMTLFKRVMGVPIKEHLNQVRVTHACALLAGTDRKILTVAMDSGYRSLSCFYEAFGAHHPVTPAEYRRRVRQPRAALAIAH